MVGTRMEIEKVHAPTKKKVYIGLPPRSLHVGPHGSKNGKILATWKRTHLSLECHITLINAWMANLPVYYLSLSKILASVHKEVGKDTKRILIWEGKQEKKKTHLVN